MHEEGYTVDRQGDGTVRFISPRGQEIPPAGPPPDLPDTGANPMLAFEAELLAMGLIIDGLPFPDRDAHGFIARGWL